MIFVGAAYSGDGNSARTVGRAKREVHLHLLKNYFLPNDDTFVVQYDQKGQ